MSGFRDEVWREILDGKSFWEASDKSQETLALFEVRSVIPLRELQEEGRIKVKELTCPTTAGTLAVFHVRLIEPPRYVDE
jgi:hypothetical protein